MTNGSIDPATIFNNGSLYPNNVVTSDVEALQNVETAAIAGVANAQFLLGLYYFHGTNLIGQNLPKAKIWLQKALDQGVVEAQNFLNQIPN